MKLLKSGELGTGILVEYDAGHISAKTNKHIIKEIASKSEDNIMMYAVLQKAGVENRNGRVYPRDILQREVDKYQTLIGQGRALSELNHPESSLVDLERSSHRIVETFWEGDILMGKLEITLGISSRGVGSIKQKGNQNIVQDDFELICFDLVSSPSTPGAYLFNDVNDRENYEESLEEEKQKNLPNTSDSLEGSLDLMKKLNSYLS